MIAEDAVLAVVGSTYDITAVAYGDTIPCDSNPSRIYSGCGGAGRNVAENMARMGLNTSIISAYGTDAFSHELLAANERARMDTSHCYMQQGGRACIYVSLLDRNGELQLAAADLALMEAIPLAWIDEQHAYIGGFPIVFVDTNNTEEMLKRIAFHAKGVLYADTVSESKASRLLPILSRIDTVKTNRGELERLAASPVTDVDSIRTAARKLIAKGVRRVFVTMGAAGCCCCTKEAFEQMPSFPVQVKNVTGAGDAFAAAVVYGSLKGLSDRQILLLGSAASHIALESPYAVNEAMCERTLLATRDALTKMERNKDYDHE